ncbi:hypothetical protein DSC45_22040 [Streptomyces sp. YIM 130001]|nr:hypothetical protein DSC45_22040 [Streptomyces sp. YIM 130001]
MTTAALLVTVAVTAVSGCVSVAQPSVRESGSPTAPPVAAPSAQRGSAPRAVEAPAREALRLMGPAPSKSTDTASPAPTPGQDAGPAPTATPGDPPGGGPPGQGRARAPRLPVGGDLPARVLPTQTAIGAELCKLGRQYGGWPPDSPQARICERASRG